MQLKEWKEGQIEIRLNNEKSKQWNAMKTKEWKSII